MALFILAVIALAASAVPGASAQAPSPIRAPRTFIVGGAGQWEVFPLNYYQNWIDSAGPVYVGDTFLFYYREPWYPIPNVREHHDMHLLASKHHFEACNETGSIEPGRGRYGARPGGVPFMVEKSGWYYFACGEEAHCYPGDQKFKVFVQPRPQTYVVGGYFKWKRGTNASEWAANMKPVFKGDRILFYYSRPTTVFQFTNSKAYSTCNFTTGQANIVGNLPAAGTVAAVGFTFERTGTFYFGSNATVTNGVRDCAAGLKFSITVLDGSIPLTEDPAVPAPGGAAH